MAIAPNAIASNDHEQAMRKLQRIHWAFGFFGLAATTSLTVYPPSANANPRARCENGTLLGTFAIRSAANGKFVRPRDGKLKAVEDQAPTQANDATLFQMYDISKLPGGAPGTFAARSAQNPSKWWRVKSNSPFVKLGDDCKADKSSYQFRRSTGQGGNYTIQSKKDDKWIKVDSNKKLKASSNNKSGNNKQFEFARFGQPTNEPPRPNTLSNIQGWWRGNNGNLYGIYQPRRSANINGTIYDNSGTPFETFNGTINGSTITANWRSSCSNTSGRRSGQINGSTIEWTSGNRRDTQLQKLNSEPTVQRNTACAQTQPTSLSGWWTTQGRGTWWLGKQTGNNVSLTKFVDGNNGKPVMQFTGQLNSAGNSAGSLRQCGQQSGSSYSLQRRTNNLYYFGGNNRSLSRSRTAPPFRANTGETCARESTDTNINGWWWDQQRQFWKAEQSNDTIILTRYRQSDGKPFSIFTGRKGNRSGTDLYSYGQLKECHSYRNRPTSFSLKNGKLISEERNIELSKYIGRINFTPQSGCDPSTSESARRVQFLTLEKTVRLTDKDVSMYYEQKSRTFPSKQIRVKRPGSRDLAISKFTGRMEGTMYEHKLCVDKEVTYSEWDQVRVEPDGSANFYINVAIYDSDSPLGSIPDLSDSDPFGMDNTDCPVFGNLVNQHYSIPEGYEDPNDSRSGAHGDPMRQDTWDREVYRRALQPGPFLRVAPGGKKTKKFTLDHPDAKVEIWYTLTNHTARVRERQN